MVSKEKQLKEELFGQLEETLIYFFIGSNIQAGIYKNDRIQYKIKGFISTYRRKILDESHPSD